MYRNDEIRCTNKGRKIHTAKASINAKEDCLRAGMNDYLTKPVALEELKEILKKYL